MQTTRFYEPRLLESLTPGAPFEMTGTARWKSRWRRNPEAEVAAREAIVQRARNIAITRYADDIHGAQDAINADLCVNPLRKTRYYSRLTATITLRLSGQAEADARKYRQSLAHIKRLHFLKEQLYSDPAMLMLDYLDKNPGKASQLPDLAQYQKLALKVRDGERWWCQILDVLDKLSSNIADQDGNFYVMKVLFAALKDAAPDLFNQYQQAEPSA